MYHVNQVVTVDGQSGNWVITAVNGSATTGYTYDVRPQSGDASPLHNVPEGMVHPVTD